ncbi:MAG: hypothetical protein ACTSPI_13655 [Candidatus Heimdallarchaeaceae archaeon]
MTEKKLEDVTQSGLEIELKGKKYKLGSIGIIDIGDFDQYLRSQKLKLADKIQDKETQLKMIEKIMNEPIDLDKEWKTLSGVVYMAWKSIQKYQPEVTLEEMNNIIDLDNFEKVSIIISNLGGKIENPPKKAKANQ